MVDQDKNNLIDNEEIDNDLTSKKNINSFKETNTNQTKSENIWRRVKDTKFFNVMSEFRYHKTGIVGFIILFFLISLTIYAIMAIPFDSFKEWNNPNFWIDNPRTAAPLWSGMGLFGEKIPEHMIFTMSSSSFIDTNTHEEGKTKKQVSETYENGVKIITHSYEIHFDSDQSPTDFMITYLLSKSEIPAAIELEIIRPDKNKFEIYFDSIRSSITGSNNNTISGRLFSTDNHIHQKLMNYLDLFNYEQDPKRPQVVLFSDTTTNSILKGDYIFNVRFYIFDTKQNVLESKLILGGKRFGLIGTDEMRRDLAIGLLWGTPIALFIGLSVSSISIFIGLIYGVISGYKGKKTDEGLMRINDIFYSLPTLPLLIILSIFVGRNIFIIVLFLIFFGWMGTAKISRSLALQIKNLQYVEAAKLIGQSDIKIIFKHIIPQLLPLTFASIAISVPGAILAEASLSFIGLGGPSVPTWGQILHEAHIASAASRGLWWWLVPPGMLIALTGLSFVLIGSTFESIFNPKLKRQ